MEDTHKSKVDILNSTLCAETNLSKKFRVEIENKWEKILCKEKLDSLKFELECLKSQYEQDFSRTNENIKRLQQNFDTGEDRRRYAASSHFHLIEDLVKVCNEDFLSMEHQFSLEIDKIKNSFNNEETSLKVKVEEERTKLIQSKHAVECQGIHILDVCSKDHQEAVEEIRNKYMEDTNNLRFITDARVEDLSEQFELVKNEYIQKTDSQSESLNQQKINDEVMTKEMSNLQMEIDSLSKSLRSLKAVGKRKAMQNANRMDQLAQRKNDILKKHKIAKERMDTLLEAQHEQLKALTKRSNERKQELHTDLNVAQHVVNLIQLTNKLEKSLDFHADYEEKSTIGTPIERVLSRYNTLLLAAQTVCKEEKHLMDEKNTMKITLNHIADGRKLGGTRCLHRKQFLLHYPNERQPIANDDTSINK